MHISSHTFILNLIFLRRMDNRRVNSMDHLILS